ncbi:MAG TPA: DnaB-like helicase N-terminal domain-containing protein, partial [Polyangiales bacterium]|nr:DnaB-like helicase N-terminal domain-containing protein [Polyangiales bacterium]
RLCEEDFHLAAHREIFSVMTALARTNMPIDTVTVREVLAQRGRLETVGGDDYLLGLTDTIPILDHLLSYAKLIHDRGRQRRLVARAIARLAALTSVNTSHARRQNAIIERTR